jgi:spore maturation protein SpmB
MPSIHIALLEPLLLGILCAIAAKRMAGELDYYHNLLEDMLKVMRAEDHLLGLRLLEYIRLYTTSCQLRDLASHKDASV